MRSVEILLIHVIAPHLFLLSAAYCFDIVICCFKFVVGEFSALLGEE